MGSQCDTKWRPSIIENRDTGADVNAISESVLNNYKETFLLLLITALVVLASTS